MKKILSILLLVFCCYYVNAQTFYEVKFVDEGTEYLGLIIYYNENSCKVRIVTDESLDDNTVYESKYAMHWEEAKSEDDIFIQFLYPDKEGMPIFFWLGDSDNEIDDESFETPYFTFDIEDTDTWHEVEYFSEIQIADMDKEYIAQFYDSSEKEYRMLMNGIRDIRQNAQNQATSSYSNNQNTTGGGTYSSVSTTGTPVLATPNLGTLNISLEEEAGISTSSSPTSSCTMHVFIVANTLVSDIGVSCRTDMMNVQNEFKGIANALKVPYKEYLIIGDSYSKANMVKSLEKLNPSANDIVVFVYTGHGFRFKDQKDYYPMIDLTSNSYQSIENNYAAMSEIYKYIQSKGARLNIILSDCCNSVVDMNRPLMGNTLFSRSSNSYDVKKLNTLFLQSSGSLVSTASSPGEYSWCSSSGGFFLLSVIQALREEISAFKADKPSWETMIDVAIKNTRYKSVNMEGCAEQRGLRYLDIKTLM